MTFCDCVGFGPLPAGKATNGVIVNSANQDVYTYTRWADDPGDYEVTRPICISGATTDRVLCDEIRNRLDGYTESIGGYRTTLKNALLMFCPARDGDSGAPAGNEGTWLGIVAAGSSNGGVACGDYTRGTAIISRAMYVDNITNNVPNLPVEP